MKKTSLVHCQMGHVNSPSPFGTQLMEGALFLTRCPHLHFMYVNGLKRLMIVPLNLQYVCKVLSTAMKRGAMLFE